MRLVCVKCRVKCRVVSKRATQFNKLSNVSEVGRWSSQVDLEVAFRQLASGVTPSIRSTPEIDLARAKTPQLTIRTAQPAAAPRAAAEVLYLNILGPYGPDGCGF